MQRTCNQCQSAFEVTDDDLAFYDKVSPVFNGKKELIPPPTLCPLCRQERRLAFRNQIYVYIRPSSATGKPIFSMYTEDAPFPVYENDVWWSDSWDGLSFGREYDFSRSFFSQIAELSKMLPRPARSVIQVENSDYSNNATGIKNCYFVFHTTIAEDCLYSERVNHSRDCIDCTYTVGSELCYDCVSCNRGYNLQSSENCDDCRDSVFLVNCRSCSDCFGCVNLRHKQYCAFNEQYSKEEYDSLLRQWKTGSYVERQALREKADSFALSFPRPHVISQMTENASGNIIFESRNIEDSFFIWNSENVKYCFSLFAAKDCQDVSTYGDQAELFYECVCCGGQSFNVRFCLECWIGSSDLLYSSYCISSSNCFGSISLKKRHYCILNKQYTKEEYEALVPKIIEHMKSTGEWGEFFPETFSPMPRNHAVTQRYFPLTKDQAISKGLMWYERDEEDVSQAIEASALPDALPPTDDAIIVKSALSGRPFKITSQEIKRYRQFSVPLPRTTYDERMEERAKKLGGIRLYERTCAKTGKPLLTTYPPDSPYVIWDRDVYEQEFGG
jgi:hypothetical protein